MRDVGSRMKLTGAVSNEHLLRADRCSLDGELQRRRYQHCSFCIYESRSTGKKSSVMLRGRALYDKWVWIANKILAQ